MPTCQTLLILLHAPLNLLRHWRNDDYVVSKNCKEWLQTGTWVQAEAMDSGEDFGMSQMPMILRIGGKSAQKWRRERLLPASDGQRGEPCI